jgi:hypothetical protein
MVAGEKNCLLFVLLPIIRNNARLCIRAMPHFQLRNKLDKMFMEVFTSIS